MDLENLEKLAGDIYYRSSSFSKKLSKNDLKVIKQVPYYSTIYVENVLKCRDSEIEQYFLKNCRDYRDLDAVLDYIKDYMKCRWSEFEVLLLTSNFEEEGFWRGKNELIIEYSKEVIGGRWPECESLIKDDGGSSFEYSVDVLKDRFVLGEDSIARTSSVINYCKEVIGGRWHEKEEIILEDFDNSLMYLKEVIKGRWKELEDRIKGDSNKCIRYVEVTRERWPLFEEKLLNLKSPKKILRYVDCVDKIGESLHNKMLMLSFSEDYREDTNRYFNIIEDKKMKCLKKLRNISRWLVDHKGKSVDEVLSYIETYEFKHTV